MLKPVLVRGITIQELKEEGVKDEELLWMLKKMMEIRLFEEKVEELFLVKGRLVGPCHLYIGQEAIATGVSAALRPGDQVVSTYRGHGHALARGVSAKALMAELFGKSTGTCKGLGGSMHAAICPEQGIMFASAIVGSGVPIACGLALAAQYKKKDSVVVAFFGDGALNTGSLHEGANMAAIWHLPLLLVCENNQYAMGTSIKDTTAACDMADRGLVYGIHTLDVDGNDALSVLKAAREAVKLLRDGRGPAFMLCRTYRLKGHGVYDKAEYRPKEEAERWSRLDPIRRLQDALLKEGLLQEGDLKTLKEELEREMEEAIRFALESSPLTFDEVWRFVYYEGT